jgi:pimeloyl-ACP methyl ester carboxylesterase
VLAAVPGCAGRVAPQSAPADPVSASRQALVAAGLRTAELPGPLGTIRYFEGGRGDTVVLLHGSGSQAGDWHQVVPALRRHYRLLIPDLPGHGESEPAAGPLPVGDLAASVAALLEARGGGQPVILVGNSLGGWTALLLAHRRPELVARVIGVSSSGIFARLNVPLQPKDRAEARALAAAIRGPFMPPLGEAELDEMLARIASGPLARLVAGLRIEDFLDTKGGEIRVPVDLIWGEEDGVLPVDYGRRLAALVSNARLHLLPGCAHMPQVHCAKEFGPLLRSVLEHPVAHD